ncbi:MAG: JAB domain-containing protein [Cyclobacteriaceae bacterium]
MNVRLSKEQKTKILNADQVYNVMQQILLRENQIRRGQEHFWIVGLDNANGILFIELISLGGTNRVQVKPREVFRVAIYKMAVRAILVHNHPSGELFPSEGDKDVTDRLLKSGDMLGIEVIDHLIISEKTFYSFEENDILEELRNNGLYELVAKEKEELRQWKIEMEKEKAVKDFAVKMAKKMKSEGFDEKAIKNFTGLGLKEIRGL